MSAILLLTLSFFLQFAPPLSPTFSLCTSPPFFFFAKGPDWGPSEAQVGFLGSYALLRLSPSFRVHFFFLFAFAGSCLMKWFTLWHPVMSLHFSLTGAGRAVLAAVAQQKLLPDETRLTFWHTVLTTVLTTVLPCSCLVHTFFHPICKKGHSAAWTGLA